MTERRSLNSASNEPVAEGLAEFLAFRRWRLARAGGGVDILLDGRLSLVTRRTGIRPLVGDAYHRLNACTFQRYGVARLP